MGIIRFILIMAVVFAHVGNLFGIKLIDSTVAVQSFFLISGYLITLVLDKKYQGKGSYKKFITSRFLRIFPIYWAILILILIMWRFENIYFPSIENLKLLAPLTVISTILSNVIIFGQDLLHFLFINAQGGFGFTINLNSVPDYALSNKLLINPPAWAISIILMFYIIAPFITKLSTKKIILITVASFALRMLLYSKGLFFDPWSYRFFPTELIFFLLGVLSYKFSTKEKKSIQKKNTDHWYMLGSAILYFLVYAYIKNWEIYHISIKQIFLFAFIAYSLPTLARGFKLNSIDNKIGELAFPLYLTHFPVWWTLSQIETIHSLPSNLFIIIVIISSLVLSKVLLEFVDKPIHKYRKKHFNAD